MVFPKEAGVCIQCKEPMWMTPETYQTLQRSGGTFHCPFGHQMVFAKGETEADRLRRELQRAKQNEAYLEDRRRAAEQEAEHQKKRAQGYKGHATRITKRAKAGVCPCCNRHFVALERHMATKHPTFTPDCPEPLRVIEGGKVA